MYRYNPRQRPRGRSSGGTKNSGAPAGGESRGFDWLVLTTALIAVVAGLVLGQALMIAGGLILSFTAVHRFQRAGEPAAERERSREP